MVVAASQHAEMEALVRRACAQLPGEEWRTVPHQSFIGRWPPPSGYWSHACKDKADIVCMSFPSHGSGEIRALESPNNLFVPTQ